MSTTKVIRKRFPEYQEPKGLPFSCKWRNNEELCHCSQCIIQNTCSSPTKTDRNFLYWEQIFYYTNVLKLQFVFSFQKVVLPVPELEKIFPQAMTRSVFHRGQLTTLQTCNISQMRKAEKCMLFSYFITKSEAQKYITCSLNPLLFNALYCLPIPYFCPEVVCSLGHLPLILSSLSLSFSICMKLSCLKLKKKKKIKEKYCFLPHIC